MIKSLHFEQYLWPKIILPAIKEALNQVDKDFYSFVDFKEVFDEDKYVKSLSNLYEEKREWLKRIYFTDNQLGQNKLLDMHKIAAVICRCVVGYKPFSFNVNKANNYKNNNAKNEDLHWIIDNYLINYKVAFNSALAITLLDFLDRLNDAQDNSLNIDYQEIETYFTKNIFDLYEKDPQILPTSHECFYKSMIVDLAINDVAKRDFDYLSFAANCFQIQQYEIVKHEYLKALN